MEVGWPHRRCQSGQGGIPARTGRPLLTRTVTAFATLRPPQPSAERMTIPKANTPTVSKVVDDRLAKNSRISTSDLANQIQDARIPGMLILEHLDPLDLVQQEAQTNAS